MTSQLPVKTQSNGLSAFDKRCSHISDVIVQKEAFRDDVPTKETAYTAQEAMQKIILDLAVCLRWHVR